MIFILIFCFSISKSVFFNLIPELIRYYFLNTIKLFLGLLTILFIALFVVIIIPKQKAKWAIKYILATIIFLPILRGPALYNLLISVLILFLLAPILIKKWTKPEWWSLTTVILILSIFYIGIVFIIGVTSPPTLDLNVIRCRDSNNTIIDRISCSDRYGEFITGNLIECKTTKINIDNLNKTLTFKFRDGTSNKTTQDNLNFLAKDNLLSVNFRIERLNETGADPCYIAESKVRFLTQGEYNNLRENRNYYFITLLGVLAFAIPPFVINLRKIFRFDGLIK